MVWLVAEVLFEEVEGVGYGGFVVVGDVVDDVFDFVGCGGVPELW